MQKGPLANVGVIKDVRYKGNYKKKGSRRRTGWLSLQAIISLPTYSTAEMVRNPPRRILKPYWKTTFFRPRNGIHPPRTIFRAN